MVARYLSGMVSLAVLGGVLLLGVYTGPRMWSGRTKVSSTAPPGWPFGGAYWRAGLRTCPAAWLMCSPATLGVAIDRYVSDSLAKSIVSDALVLTSMQFVVLATTVLLANKPSWLVMPWLRHLPGLLDDLKSERER